MAEEQAQRSSLPNTGIFLQHLGNTCFNASTIRSVWMENVTTATKIPPLRAALTRSRNCATSVHNMIFKNLQQGLMWHVCNGSTPHGKVKSMNAASTNRIADPTWQLLCSTVPSIFGVDTYESIVPVQCKQSDTLALQVGHELNEVFFGPIQLVLVARLWRDKCIKYTNESIYSLSMLNI